MMNDTFKEINTLEYWCQKILPIAYDDSLSYMELLGKVTAKLNDLISNNAVLPTYISSLIQQYITSGAIGEVINNILTSYMLNVKNPPVGLKPAVGDGTLDDTEAIQGCIDYASTHGGKCVYLPSGSYLCGSLTLKDNVSLSGFDRTTTKIVLKGGATEPLIHGSSINNTLSKLYLDGNMDIQVNNLKLIELTGKDYTLSELTLTDGYDLLNLTLTGGFCSIDNVHFKHAVENSLVVAGTSELVGVNLIFDSLSDLLGKRVIKNGINNAVYTGVVSTANVVNPIEITANDVFISATLANSNKAFIDTGLRNTVVINGQSSKEYYAGDTAKTVIGNDNTSATNMYEYVTMLKKIICNNYLLESTNSTETLTGVKLITAVTSTENISGVKSVNANTLNEDITGNKTVEANNITNTATLLHKTVGTTVEENSTNSVEAVAQTKDITANNITEHVTNNKTVNAKYSAEIVETTKDVTANILTENIATTKTVNAVNSAEVLTGNKTTTANTLVEDIVGNKTVEATNITDTATALHKTIAVSLEENATNSTEVVTQTKDITANNLTEHVNNNKTVNAKYSAEIVETTKDVTANVLTENVGTTKTVNATNIVETIVEDKTTNAVDVTVTATGVHKITANGMEAVTPNYKETIASTKEIIANDIILNTANPLTYKAPTVFNPHFNSVPFKNNGVVYNVLVANDKTDELYTPNPLAKKKVLLCGDSIGYGMLSPTTHTDRPWIKTFEALTSSIVTNYSISGASLSNISEISFCNTVGNNNYAEYDIVMLAFGVNDYANNKPIEDDTTNNSFKGAYREVIAHILGENPDVKLVLCTTPYVQYLRVAQSAGWTYENYVDATFDVARDYGLSVIDFCFGMGLNADNVNALTWDTLHPNQTGYDLMGEYASKVYPGITNYMRRFKSQVWYIDFTPTDPLVTVVPVNYMDMECMQVDAIVSGTKVQSFGTYSKFGTTKQIVNYTEVTSGNKVFSAGRVIMCQIDGANWVRGTIQNVKSRSFEIAWERTGTVGTVRASFLYMGY